MCNCFNLVISVKPFRSQITAAKKEPQCTGYKCKIEIAQNVPEEIPGLLKQTEKNLRALIEMSRIKI